MTSSAQKIDTLYNESDLVSFVKIKTGTAAAGINFDSIISEVVSASGISLTRLKEIITKGFESRAEILTETEEKSIKLFKAAFINYSDIKKEHLIHLCKLENISVEKYEFLHRKFIKSISFQQSLIPLFKLQQSEK